MTHTNPNAVNNDPLGLNEEQELPLFERLGGNAAISAAVDIFYDKLLKDERIRPFFAGVDMKTQIAKQKAFMAYAFGGFDSYRGKDMRSAHERLVKEKGLNEDHFNIVAGYLQETLKELQVEDTLISEVMDVVGSTKNDVLNL